MSERRPVGRGGGTTVWAPGWIEWEIISSALLREDGMLPKKACVEGKTSTCVPVVHIRGYRVIVEQKPLAFGVFMLCMFHDPRGAPTRVTVWIPDGGRELCGR